MNIARTLLIPLTALLTLSVAGSALAIPDIDIDYLTRSDIGDSADGVVTYQHVFDPIFDPDPDKVVTSVESAWLYVGLVQWPCDSGYACADNLLFEANQVEIDLTGIAWNAGKALVQIAWGDVKADDLLVEFLEHQGILDITVSVSDGDLAVFGSKMVTRYNWEPTGGAGSGGVNAIPEPSAALVFAFGALVVTRSARRNRR